LISGAVYIISIVITIIIVFADKISMPYPEPSNTNEPDYMTLYYYRPWIRIAPYALGLLMALTYFDGINGEKWPKVLLEKVKNSNFWKLGFYLLGNFLTIFVVGLIITQQKRWNRDNGFTQLYLIFSRSLISLGFGFILYPNLIVKDSILNIIFGNRIMVNIG